MSGLKPYGCRGCIYTELTNDGHGKRRDGKPRKKRRYVAEIVRFGKRSRFRSTRLDTVQQWLINESAQKLKYV